MFVLNRHEWMDSKINWHKCFSWWDRGQEIYLIKTIKGVVKISQDYVCSGSNLAMSWWIVKDLCTNAYIDALDCRTEQSHFADIKGKIGQKCFTGKRPESKFWELNNIALFGNCFLVQKEYEHILHSELLILTFEPYKCGLLPDIVAC